jgi:hypothetical protein
LETVSFVIEPSAVCPSSQLCCDSTVGVS